MSQSNSTTLAVVACVLRLKVVMRRTGLSRSTLYSLMNPSSMYYDPAFPKRILLTGRIGGAVGFIESELNQWIESREAA
ncbi:helix-turn-helix transcriptional regulator [Pseudomonas sp. NPDC078416]|uniref:helix-turn-helix transcriptional regulator n=1 Tax=Pseudomonas sp. NPDC078416 TaxID=3390637 RepID=UPI003D07112E